MSAAPSFFDATQQFPVSEPAALQQLSDDEQREQWLRDLETLDRLEQQALYPDPCFFCAMGEVLTRRMDVRNVT